MLEMVFLYSLALVWIFFATIQDVKTSEIANWLSFSLIVFALGFRFFYSVFAAGSFGFFYQGVIWLGIFFVLGNLLYYGKIFAGGDTKLFIALGAVIPVSEKFFTNAESLVLFMVIFLLVGGLYSLIASARFCFKNYPEFKKEFGKQLKVSKNKILFSLLISVILIVLGYLSIYFFFLGILTFILPYLYLYAKSVDKAAMIKKISVRNLREGDWLYQDVKIGKKVITATWDGLGKKEILFLRKHKKRVLVREGVVFTPVFLIAFLVFFYLMAYGSRYSFW